MTTSSIESSLTKGFFSFSTTTRKSKMDSLHSGKFKRKILWSVWWNYHNVTRSPHIYIPALDSFVHAIQCTWRVFDWFSASIHNHQSKIQDTRAKKKWLFHSISLQTITAEQMAHREKDQRKKKKNPPNNQLVFGFCYSKNGRGAVS